MKKILTLLLTLMLAFGIMATLASCGGDDTDGDGAGTPPAHTHSYVEGVCSCGAKDPSYTPPHTHTFVDGVCECGAEDPNYDKRVNPCKACEEGEYAITSQTYPSTFEDGHTVYTCNVCSDSYEETKPATGEMNILVIGDASTSTTIGYIDEILLSEGVSKVLVGTANFNHSSGASISDQWKNVSNNKASYTYTPTVNGTAGKILYRQSLTDILASEDWNYVIIGQSIPEAGNSEAYAELENYLAYLREAKPAGAKILWNMSWAYNKESTHAGFESYDYDQAKMYDGILSAFDKFIAKNESIDAILPVGAAVQNLRTTFLDGKIGSTAGIALEAEIGSYIFAVTWCSEILGKSAEEISSAIKSSELMKYSDVLDSAISGALANSTVITEPLVKSFKILIFGNSYSNDAVTYLTNIFQSAGYHEVIIGSITDGGCNINHHWWNIDDTLEDYHPGAEYEGMTGVEGTAGCYVRVNGVTTYSKAPTLKERYIEVISATDWDYVSIQHGPDTVEKTETYSHLPDLIGFIEEHLISEDTEFVYHMVWKYNDNLSTTSQHTSYQYQTILDITQNLVLKNEQFGNRVVPGATFRQNLVSSYLEDVDISRDYGHMGLTLGRYALGLLWYCYYTGGSVDDVTYIPTADLISAEEKAKYKLEYGHTHLDITEEDMLIVKEAIENALKTPYEITQSKYTTKPSK